MSFGGIGGTTEHDRGQVDPMMPLIYAGVALVVVLLILLFIPDIIEMFFNAMP